MSFKRCLSVSLALLLLFSAFVLPLSVLAQFSDGVAQLVYEGLTIPAYDGDLYEELNGNVPRFTATELTQEIYEHYGTLDSLQRVTVCEANIDRSLMPAENEKRGDISSVKPTGWVQKSYAFISGRYLYNRSHLIGWQLTAENANKNNLMTGTRSFNAAGMLPFENEVASYVKAAPENNVLYRVTPVFQEDNLLASGVIMEAESVDDAGASVCFCVFVYNVESGVSIDYTTGESQETGFEEVQTDIAAAYIRLKELRYTYTGRAVCPLEYVTVDGKRLTEGTDYTVTYIDNTEIGTATVLITGINAYCGTAAKSFTIAKPLPPKVTLKKLKRTKRAFTASWKPCSGISGYQLQYATNKKFKNAKTLTVNSSTAKSKAVKRLKAKRVYYVRIRSYKTVNKTRFYSPWSKVKSVKTR